MGAPSLNLQHLLEEYKSSVFDTGQLGHCTKFKAHIRMKPNAVPRFHKARPIAFARLPAVKAEIERMEKLKVIKRVDFSDWAAPIVPVLKANGAVRICGDFKVTINPGMEV